MQDSVCKVLKLMQLAERLKCELRHSWLSNGRQESVAEHSWRLALLVMTLAPYLEQSVNVEKALKMAIVHDLVEAKTGDVPTFEVITAEQKQQKQANEQAAIESIRAIFDDALGDELYDLWQEFEARATREAKYVTALDKLECQIQHNEADLSTWNAEEREQSFRVFDNGVDFNFDQAVQTLHQLLQQQTREKLQQEKAMLTD